jgi:hypothetical protein
LEEARSTGKFMIGGKEARFLYLRAHGSIKYPKPLICPPNIAVTQTTEGDYRGLNLISTMAPVVLYTIFGKGASTMESMRKFFRKVTGHPVDYPKVLYHIAEGLSYTTPGHAMYNLSLSINPREKGDYNIYRGAWDITASLFNGEFDPDDFTLPELRINIWRKDGIMERIASAFRGIYDDVKRRLGLRVNDEGVKRIPIKESVVAPFRDPESAYDYHRGIRMFHPPVPSSKYTELPHVRGMLSQNVMPSAVNPDFRVGTTTEEILQYLSTNPDYMDKQVFLTIFSCSSWDEKLTEEQIRELSHAVPATTRHGIAEPAAASSASAAAASSAAASSKPPLRLHQARNESRYEIPFSLDVAEKK